MRRMLALFVRLAVMASIAMLIGACAKPPELLPMPATDMSMLEPAVRNRIAAAHAEFDAVAARKPSTLQLAKAYGELAMVYHAQDLATPAKIAYTNAHRLDPRDTRWPYLLAHLYADKSKVADAVKYFEIVRDIDPNDVPTQVYLGQMYFLNGDLDKARAMFEKAQVDNDARAAALTGLGKVALAKGDYQEAAARLEEVLKLWPSASRLRQPLATAYRGLGDIARAEANLAHYAADGGEPGVSDPIVDALSEKVAVSQVLLRRGQRFGKEGRFDLAEQAFRAAVASDPSNAEAIANLGISLANLGRTEEARDRLVESLRMDDTIALAHFSLGVVYDRQGADASAIEQYRAAIKHDPNNVQAVVYLADATLRTGAALEAAHWYRQALAKAPDSTRISHALAMALIKAGRHAEARKVLESALSAQPGNAELLNALGRLLATAPDAAVRDGRRALEMAKSLFEATRSLAVGQTYAMAFAEIGNFTEAVKLQQETIIGYERSGTPVDKSFLARNLVAYQQHRPAREGWSHEDPVFQPRSAAAARVTAPAASAS
jgi:tetratricopeptide (TPR) repeat protein